MLTKKGKKFFFLGAILIGFVVLTVATSPDSSPQARIQRINDECFKTYGNTDRGADCSMEFILKIGREMKATEIDAIYRRAR